MFPLQYRDDMTDEEVTAAYMADGANAEEALALMTMLRHRPPGAVVD